MTKRTYGILAGMIGTAVGAWWWTRQRTRNQASVLPARGTTIFHNTPTPTAFSDEGVI
ncbi:MAG TPA: hypothetical protein VF147_05505 [Vicinamibacterales bacterium]